MKWGMKGRVAGLLWKALGMVAGVSACTDANESLTIVQAQVPNETCAIDENGSGGTRLTEGVLDVGLDKPYGYVLYPLLSNNLLALSTSGGIEPNRITITGAEMELLPPKGVTMTWPAGCGAKFEDYSTAMIQPGSRRAIRISALSSCHAAIIREMFLKGQLNPSLTEEVKFRSVVRAKGKHGSADIHSDPFEFPIRVCYGCLQTGFGGAYAEFSYAISPPKVLACENMSENPYRGNACNPAQDFGPILCCAQDPKGEKLLCPGIPAAKGMDGGGSTP
jgi:hypothetical protein